MLTEAHCRSARPKASSYKLHDAGGLFLLVLPSGTRTWRQKYRFGGKEKQLTHGHYPVLSLKEARTRRDAAKRMLLDGIDPGKRKDELLAARRGTAAPPYTFKLAAMRWHKLQSSGWKPRHAEKVLASLETEVFPLIGDRPIAELKPADIKPVIEAVQDRGAVDRAHRVLMRISRIFQLAVVDERVQADPAAPLTPILKPVPKRKYPAILQLDEARSALLAFEKEPHWPSTKLASRLLALTACRPGPLRFAEAAEFRDLDGEDPRWVIPAAKMKLNLQESLQGAFDFTIPLPPQAVATVKVALQFADGRNYVFPSAQFGNRPISENAVSTAYRRSPGFGGRHVPHGWRSTFATVMNERASELDRAGDRAIIDLMLAHIPTGVESHYNRAAFMTRRRFLATEWAELLSDGLPPPESLLDGPRN